MLETLSYVTSSKCVKQIFYLFAVIFRTFIIYSGLFQNNQHIIGVANFSVYGAQHIKIHLWVFHCP